MNTISESVLDVKVRKARDMTMYFAIRIGVTVLLFAGYYYTIKKDIDYVQFFIATSLLFAPFALDYYPRQHEDKWEMRLRRFGMLIPSLTVVGVLLIGVFNGDSSYWASSTDIWLKILCVGAGITVVFLAFLDYNNYNRRSQLTQDMKQHATEYIEESKAESAEARLKRNEAIKKEGFKKLIIESEKKRKKKKSKI
ncbi:hypothetical protein ACTHOS_13205 [Bacillus safensis]|uniref:hypothetical protein n=1 Tax=Bacillus TaxID=1386 RepID=UPI00273C7514|nr:hypothetical protein [Bacillus safensis]MDP4564061.1 hypothetical protein [Bacillus safensis]MEC0921385.1 hypothetical protein [Bacillus safensis]MEC0993581.1 hypothetical protein [Bacillus safensis]MEC0997230.1 hypothetical protein [Bacillus safensis]